MKHSDVWLVVTIVNKTDKPIHYQLLLAGAWQQFVLHSRHQTVHTALYEDPLLIAYDYKYVPGTQSKQYQVAVTKVAGHEPTESDKQKAKVCTFILDQNGDIQLYANPLAWTRLIRSGVASSGRPAV